MAPPSQTTADAQPAECTEEAATPIPPFPQLEEASATKGLRAVAAEFVPTGGAAAEGQPAGAYALGLGGAADDGSWWTSLGDNAVWLDDAYGQEATAEQDLYLWDYCP